MARRWANAYHDWYIGGVRQIRMNTRPRAEGYPRTHVKRIGGWDSRPVLDQAEPLRPSGIRGTIPVSRTTREKDLIYELQQQATSEEDINTSMAALRAAFSDPNSTGFLVAEPWPDHAGDIWATFARAEDFDGDAQLVYDPRDYPGAWRLDPILTIRQLDGRWLWANESGTFLEPMSWTGEPSVAVTNSGDAPCEPHVEVTGVNEFEDLHIGRDIAGGGTLDLWFRNMPAGTLASTVAIDFPSRSLTIDGVLADDKHYDGRNSTWWDEYAEGVPPGTHTLWHGPGSGDGISVSFYSCGW